MSNVAQLTIPDSPPDGSVEKRRNHGVEQMSCRAGAGTNWCDGTISAAAAATATAVVTVAVGVAVLMVSAGSHRFSRGPILNHRPSPIRIYEPNWMSTGPVDIAPK